MKTPFRSPYFVDRPAVLSLRWLIYPPGFPGLYVKSCLPIL
jgi:hypothetical protein